MRHLFAIIFLLCGGLLYAGRISKPANTYNVILEQTDLMVVGRVTGGEIVDLSRQKPQPTAIPRSGKTIDGRQVPTTPSSFSWNRVHLNNPTSLWAFRATLQVLHDPSGSMPENRVITVILGYGSNEMSLENYLQTEYAKSWCEEDSYATFHLKKVVWPQEDRFEYDLVSIPWITQRADVDLKKTETDIRWARFQAYQRIETLLGTFHDNRRADFDEIFNLLYSEPENMGEPVWLPGEMDDLVRMDKRTKSGAAKETEWRRWWDSYKTYFIDAPFRRVVEN